jgi:hypothetical protein
MHEQFEREGYALARLPVWQKERVTAGKRRWERPGQPLVQGRVLQPVSAQR